VPIIPLIVIAIIVLLRHWLQQKTAWSTVTHPERLYSFEYPGTWAGVIESEGIRIASRDDQARVTAVAFTDEANRPLSERAAMRFTVTTIPVTANALTPAREEQGRGWKGLIYEDEGPARDTGHVRHETTLCAESGKLFVIVCVSVGAEVHADHKDAIAHILGSLRLNAGAADA
jgi:hypothetical protein